MVSLCGANLEVCPIAILTVRTKVPVLYSEGIECGMLRNTSLGSVEGSLWGVKFGLSSTASNSCLDGYLRGGRLRPSRT